MIIRSMARVLEDSKFICSIPEDVALNIMVGDHISVADRRERVDVGSEPCRLHTVVKSRYIRLSEFGDVIGIDIVAERVG